MSAIGYPGSAGTVAVPRRRARVVGRRRTNVVMSMIIFAAWVSALACGLYQVINLAGFLQIEKCRQMARVAELRAAAAENGASALRLEVERIQRADALERWASVNGFEPSYAVDYEETAN